MPHNSSSRESNTHIHTSTIESRAKSHMPPNLLNRMCVRVRACLHWNWSGSIERSHKCNIIRTQSANCRQLASETLWHCCDLPLTPAKAAVRWEVVCLSDSQPAITAQRQSSSSSSSSTASHLSVVEATTMSSTCLELQWL